MRAQRRIVIDPMYIEDSDMMKVSKILMGGPEGVQIAKHYKNKFDSIKVYLLIGKIDGQISYVISYCSREGKDVFYSFDETGNIEAFTTDAFEDRYSLLLTQVYDFPIIAISSSFNPYKLYTIRSILLSVSIISPCICSSFVICSKSGVINVSMICVFSTLL